MNAPKKSVPAKMSLLRDTFHGYKKKKKNYKKIQKKKFRIKINCQSERGLLIT